MVPTGRVSTARAVSNPSMLSRTLGLLVADQIIQPANPSHTMTMGMVTIITRRVVPVTETPFLSSSANSYRPGDSVHYTENPGSRYPTSSLMHQPGLSSAGPRATVLVDEGI